MIQVPLNLSKRNSYLDVFSSSLNTNVNTKNLASCLKRIKGRNFAYVAVFLSMFLFFSGWYFFKIIAKKWPLSVCWDSTYVTGGIEIYDLLPYCYELSLRRQLVKDELMVMSLR